MQDIVVESYLKDFIESQGFSDIEESEQFERFCSFSILNKEFSSSLNREDLDDISVGLNKGIDSIAFSINGELIKNIEQLEDLLNINQHLYIKIYFIQAKTTGNFKDSEVGAFCDTIIDFLEKTPRYKFTAETKNYHDIYIKITDHVGRIKRYDFFAYFCCTGTWNSITSISTTLEKKTEEIKRLKLFDDVELKPVDKNSLIELYKKTTNPVKGSFEFRNKVQIHGIDDVEEAFIGYVPFIEFKKLIVDEDNGKLKSLFNDNVRDFLGLDNEVNCRIKETLDDRNFSQFSLLNNGITIIAEENTGRQERFILSNYQIVNGCQTSNVLYDALYIEGIDNTLIPLKLIITKNDLLRDKIILSTNNQSTILKERLLALTIFQKQLEEYYRSANDGLFYERRVNQYTSLPGIKQKSIVDIREQIKSFIAMFFDEPHVVSGYFSRVYKERGAELFNETHPLEPYYISGLLQFQFKEFLNSREIERKYNKTRYHLFLLFRMIIEGNQKYNKNNLISNVSKRFYEQLLNAIRNKEGCLLILKQACKIIDDSGIDILIAKEIYKQSTTKTFIETLKKSRERKFEFTTKI